jgi:hypothetical protein
MVIIVAAEGELYISVAMTWKKGRAAPGGGSSRQVSILALIIFPASAVSMISPFRGARLLIQKSGAAIHHGG